MSDPMAVSRRLVAVFAADVEGYSHLMGADEVGTLKGLTERRAILDRIIGDHRGRIANTAGDSVLAEFGSAVDAVQCAVEAQAALSEANSIQAPDRRICFRMGIHIGDVMIRAGDLFGDGVNIAARLQSIAKPGGVCISGATYDQVRKVLPMTFADLGVQTVKNIEEPIRAYEVRAQGEHVPILSRGGQNPLALPDKPSIAVLPFQNMSGDPEQEYFADGMVEEITTALARFAGLFVIARNSSFTYKGRAIDIKHVGRELGVRYVLEGSVRNAAGKIRITGQLIDAATGTHLWADRFEGNIGDVFALQDKVTENVVSAIAPKLLQTEIDLAVRRRPDNIGAYDLVLRALPHLYSLTREGLAEALHFLSRALEIDPRYGTAASLAAGCHLLSVVQGWAVDPKLEIAEATRLSSLALSIDPNDPETLAMVGRGLAYMSGDFGAAIEMVDRAVALNPNSASVWDQRSWAYQYAGRAEEAILSFERAIRLSPLDPMLYTRYAGMGIAFLKLDRFEEAAAAAHRALRQNKTFSTTYRCLVAALAHLGRDEEARKAVASLLDIEPNFHIAEWMARAGKWQSIQFVEGLRKAGLPE
jgi:adenylate cyclase